MANFNNSSKIFAIQARQGVVARVVVNSQVQSGQKATMKAFTATKDASDIALELGMFAMTAEQLIKANVQRALILMSSNTATRFYEAQGAMKAQGATVETAIAKVMQTIGKWQSNNPGLEEAMPEAIRAYFALRDAGLDVTIGKLTETHLFELDRQACQTAGIEDGQKLTFVDSTDTEYGIICRDMSFLSGEHEVVVRGNRYYVKRQGNSNLGIRRLIGWNETDEEKDAFESMGLKRDVLSAYSVLQEKLPHAADEAELVEDEVADI